MMKMRVKLAAFALVVGPFLSGGDPARAAIQALHITNELCTDGVKKAESEAQLPRHLLSAISLAESGRWDARQRASFAWPWTVTNGGSSMYFPTKEEAIAAVKDLQSKGKTNIDVGCMQINLFHHPHAFETIEDAFDPLTNAGYAARFLAGLYKETQSWAEAAGRYHSNDPTRLGAYRDKVLALWQLVSGRKPSELGRIDVVTTETEEPELRRRQQEAIQQQFRARLEAERSAPKNNRAMAQLEKFRQDRYGPNFRNQSAAVQRAERVRKQTAQDFPTKQGFAEKRKAQLAAWRERLPQSALVQEPPADIQQAVPSELQKLQQAAMRK